MDLPGEGARSLPMGLSSAVARPVRSIQIGEDMSLAEVFAPIEAKYRSQVLQSTWGHLKPRTRKLYPAKIVFTCAGYGGSYEIIDAQIKGVGDSPWLFEHMMDFVAKKAVQGKVHVFEGSYWVSKRGRGHFRGKIRTPRL